MFRSKFPGGHLASRLSPFVTQMPPREILCDICLLLNLFRIYVETCTLPQCFSHLRNGYLHFVSEYYHAKSHTLTQMQGSIETVFHCRQSSLSMRSVKYSTIPLVVVPTCHCPFPWGMIPGRWRRGRSRRSCRSARSCRPGCSSTTGTATIILTYETKYYWKSWQY